MKVFKYPLKLEDEQVIATPEHWDPLSVQEQQGVICIWAIVDESAPINDGRKIYIRGTGHPLDPDVLDANFLGTCQTHNGQFVWHIWES